MLPSSDVSRCGRGGPGPVWVARVAVVWATGEIDVGVCVLLLRLAFAFMVVVRLRAMLMLIDRGFVGTGGARFLGTPASPLLAITKPDKLLLNTDEVGDGDGSSSFSKSIRGASGLEGGGSGDLGFAMSKVPSTWLLAGEVPG